MTKRYFFGLEKPPRPFIGDGDPYNTYKLYSNSDRNHLSLRLYKRRTKIVGPIRR